MSGIGGTGGIHGIGGIDATSGTGGMNGTGGVEWHGIIVIGRQTAGPADPWARFTSLHIGINISGNLAMISS